MPVMPAICDTCGTVFKSGFSLENIERAVFVGSMAGPCPVCGNLGHVPDGVFRFVGEAIEILSAPQRSVHELKAFNSILQNAREKNSTLEQVSREIQSKTPELKPLLTFLKNEEFKYWLTTLIAILSLVISMNGNKETETSPEPIQKVEVEQVIHHIYEEIPSSSTNSHFQDQSSFKQQPIRVNKIGRNEPCPCGSNIKYKYCHGH